MNSVFSLICPYVLDFLIVSLHVIICICFVAFIKNYSLEVLNKLIQSYTRKETEVASFSSSPKDIHTNSCRFCHFENIHKNKALDEVFSNAKDLKVPDHFTK